MKKKKRLVSYQNLAPNILAMVHQQYPDGFDHAIVQIENHKQEVFEAITLETNDTIYLIKVTCNKTTDASSGFFCVDEAMMKKVPNAIVRLNEKTMEEEEEEEELEEGEKATTEATEETAE